MIVAPGIREGDLAEPGPGPGPLERAKETWPRFARLTWTPKGSVALRADQGSCPVRPLVLNQDPFGVAPTGPGLRSATDPFGVQVSRAKRGQVSFVG